LKKRAAHSHLSTLIAGIDLLSYVREPGCPVRTVS